MTRILRDKLSVKYIDSAKKRHQCESCEGTIGPGKAYVRMTVFGKPIEHAKVCLSCFTEYFSPHWDSNLYFAADLEDVLIFMRNESYKDQYEAYLDAEADYMMERAKEMKYDHHQRIDNIRTTHKES